MAVRPQFFDKLISDPASRLVCEERAAVFCVARDPKRKLVLRDLTAVH